LLSGLSPQERAAVVLNEAFNLTLEEIAEALSTTPGTVKSALHRGRGKLVEPADEREAPPKPQILDAFCAAFNAGDLDRLTPLLLDTTEIEVVRVHTEYGPEAARRGVFQGMLFGARRLADPARLDGLDPAFFHNVLPQVPRVEPRLHRGEWLLVHWYAHSDGEAVRAISRVETDGERLTRVRNYFYTPDVLAEICADPPRLEDATGDRLRAAGTRPHRGRGPPFLLRAIRRGRRCSAPAPAPREGRLPRLQQRRPHRTGDRAPASRGRSLTRPRVGLLQ